MGTSYLQLESGVLVAQFGGGYPEIRAALKDHDRNLELGQVSGVWKVYHRFGDESHQVHFLCDWRDPDGTPRELSFGLVDKVKALDRNTAFSTPSVEELDAKRRHDLDKHRQRISEDLAQDYDWVLNGQREIDGLIVTQAVKEKL